MELLARALAVTLLTAAGAAPGAQERVAAPGARERVAAPAARERVVAPGTPIQPLLDAARPGQVIRLAPGRHAGPLRIGRTLSLLGEPGAVLVGPGTGSVI